MIRQRPAVKAVNPWRNLREVERDEVDFRVIMRRADGERLDARVVNISRLGLMARTDDIFHEEEPVLIELPVIGETRAKIAWALGGRVGGQFVAPIEPDDYKQLLAAAARPRQRWPA